MGAKHVSHTEDFAQTFYFLLFILEERSEINISITLYLECGGVRASVRACACVRARACVCGKSAHIRAICEQATSRPGVLSSAMHIILAFAGRPSRLVVNNNNKKSAVPWTNRTSINVHKPALERWGAQLHASR